RCRRQLENAGLRGPANQSGRIGYLGPGSSLRRTRPSVGCSVRGDGSEQAVLLVVRPGGEVEGRRRPGGSVVAEADAPQAVDSDRTTGRVAKAARSLPRS